MSPRQLILLVAVGSAFLACRRSAEPQRAPSPPPVVTSTTTSSAAVFVAPSSVQLDSMFVIDARGFRAGAPYLPNAHVVEWSSLRDGWGRTGRLATEAALRQAFEALGVKDHVPVLVYGGWDEGWGEEGRVWWTLRYLGHPRVQILEGGVKVWAQTRKVVSDPSEDASGGSLKTTLQPQLRATKAQVQSSLRSDNAVILDARRPDEFAGATPYLSARGGHVPSAKSLTWSRLITAQGLRPLEELRRELGALGVSTNTPVSSYCTGGVRSAFSTAVLHHLGYTQAANYDGSWWEWAADETLPIASP